MNYLYHETNKPKKVDNFPLVHFNLSYFYQENLFKQFIRKEGAHIYI